MALDMCSLVKVEEKSGKTSQRSRKAKGGSQGSDSQSVVPAPAAASPGDLFVRMENNGATPQTH